MRRRSALSPLIIACIAIFVLFNIITFLFVFDYSHNFWVGYIAVLIAWLCLLLSVVSTKVEARSGTQAMFTSIPIVMYSAIHFFVQLLAGILVMVITRMNAKVGGVILLVVFFFYAFVLLLTIFYKRRTLNIHAEVSQSREFIESMQPMLREMVSRCSNSTIKTKLQEIAEALEYSDPISSPLTADCEERIEELITTIKKNLGAVGTANLQMCDEVLHLIDQRNHQCSKGKNN